MSEGRSAPLLGAHVSVAGGLKRAFERADRLGATAMQIFQRPNLQWRTRPLTDAAVEAFRKAHRVSGVGPVLAHACYLVNLASDDPLTRRRSRRVFADELRRAGRLGVIGVVLHPGSADERTKALRRIADGVNLALAAAADAQTMVVLETAAGAGRSVGGRFEDLAEIIARVEEQDRVGVCLDTAHVFAAGYDLRTREACGETFRRLDETVGLERLVVIHLNDARGGLGSRLDRHVHIGEGGIGLDAFRFLMSDARFEAVPKIIETPKRRAGREMDPVNLGRLRRLAGAGR